MSGYTLRARPDSYAGNVGAFEDRDREPNCPTIWGYALAVGIGHLCLTTSIWLPSVAADETGYGAWFFAIFFFGGMVALWFGLVTLPIVHVACHRVRRQSVHVAVTGLLNAWVIAALLLMPYGYPPKANDQIKFWGMIAIVGACAAIGRAAVIPSVKWRRQDWSARAEVDPANTA